MEQKEFKNQRERLLDQVRQEQAKAEKNGSDLSDASFTYTEPTSKTVPTLFQGKSVLKEAGCCSRLFFSWARPFLRQAHQGPLHMEMFGKIREKENSKLDLARLEAKYGEYKAENKKSPLLKAAMRVFLKDILLQGFFGSLAAMLLFVSPLVVLKLIEFVQSAPLPGTDPDPFEWDKIKEGVYLSAALVISQFIAYFIFDQMTYFQVETGCRSSNAVISLIFKKHDRLSPATNKDFNSGQIVNFVQVDAVRLLWVCYQLADIAQIPFVFGLAFTLCFKQFGYSFLSGLSIFVIATLVSILIGLYFNKQEIIGMRRKDRRMQVTSESIVNMKLLKTNAWQGDFLQRIQRRRVKEIETLKRIGYATAVIIASIYFFPSLLPAITFSTYIATGHTLDLDEAVGALVLFNLITEPLIQVPMFLTEIIGLVVSMKRIEKFLDLDEVQQGIIKQIGGKEELDDYSYNEMAQNDIALGLKGDFCWGLTKQKSSNVKQNQVKTEKKDMISEIQELEKLDSKTPESILTLQDIDIKIQKGDFVCIIGDVGAGKSSILHSIIGDMIFIPADLALEIKKADVQKRRLPDAQLQEMEQIILAKDFKPEFAPVQVNGTISYVEQSSWIQNMTVRDNILFGETLDIVNYKKTIKACQLERDLNILPGGDLTEIGEKGINLSGGQKARISLARAVYSNRDIVLMDDPISALDTNVRNFIFKDVFCGLIKKKTRILVTHSVDFLDKADKIIVLRQGKIQAQGTFVELQDNTHLKAVLKINENNFQETLAQRNNDVEKNKDSKRDMFPKSEPDNKIEQLQPNSPNHIQNNSFLTSDDEPSQNNLSLQSNEPKDIQIAVVKEEESLQKAKNGNHYSGLSAKDQQMLEKQRQENLKNEVREDSDSSNSDLANEIAVEEVNSSDNNNQFGQGSSLQSSNNFKSFQKSLIRSESMRLDADLAIKGRMMENESEENVVVSWNTYRKLLNPAGGCCTFLIVNICMFLFILCTIGLNYFTQKWANEPQDLQYASFEYFALIIFGFSIGTAIFIFIRVAILMTSGLKVAQQIHNKTIELIFNSPINLFFDVTPIGKILNRFSKDLSVVDQQLFYDFGSFLSQIYQAGASLLVAVFVAPIIGVVIFFFIVLGTLLFKYSMQAYKDCYRIEMLCSSPIISLLQETFNGNSVIRAFGKEQQFKDKSAKLIDNTLLANQVTMGVFGWYNLRLNFLATLVLAAGCAICILLRSQKSPVQLGLMLQYLLTLQVNCVYAMYFFGEIERKMVSAQRLFDLESIQQENDVVPGKVAKKVSNSWPMKGEIEFRDVQLRYQPTSELVLKNLSFKIRSGEKIGVVGRTGAGKSTLSLALSRIVELCGGQISIDNVDIGCVRLNELRNKITCISQDPTLFSGTLRFNLDPFNKCSLYELEALLIRANLKELLQRSADRQKSTESKTHNNRASHRKSTQHQSFRKSNRQSLSVGPQIAAAAEPSTTIDDPIEEDVETILTSQQDIQNLDDRFAEDLKHNRGLFLKIQEGGSNLSAGERQLICICRAILRKNKVIVLDEATANIDVVTEQRIQNLIENEFSDSTVITIAHRLNTIIRSDRVLVLSYGQVVEYDSPRELMSNTESHFAKLIQELEKEQEMSDAGSSLHFAKSLQSDKNENQKMENQEQAKLINNT